MIDRRRTRPDPIGIILDRPIGTEGSHGECSLDGSFIPFIMVSTPEVVHESLSLDVRSKVVRYLTSAEVSRQRYTHQVVIMFVHSLEKSFVDVAISESTGLYSLEGLGELQISFIVCNPEHKRLPRETSQQER